MVPIRFLVRGVAIVVGLANLAALTSMFGDAFGVAGGPLGYGPLLVITVVISGLATSEIVLRLFGLHLAAREFSRRYLTVVFAMFLGGLLMGTLVGIALPVAGAGGLVETSTLVRNALLVGFLGAICGGGLGFVEGWFLAFPLAAVLGRFDRGGP